MLTPKLRALSAFLCTKGPLKDEVSAAAFDNLIPTVARRLAKRPLGELTCPSTRAVHVVYATDDNSLYRVDLSSLRRIADAQSVLDALLEAGLPLDVVEQGRRRLKIGGAAYEDVENRGMSADGAIHIYVDFLGFPPRFSPDAIHFFVSVLE